MINFRKIFQVTHCSPDPSPRRRDAVCHVSSGHQARPPAPVLSRHTGGLPAGRECLGYRRHESLPDRMSRHTLRDGGVRSPQRHSRRQGCWPRAHVCAPQRSHALLPGHLRPRPQAHRRGLRSSEVSSLPGPLITARGFCIQTIL